MDAHNQAEKISWRLGSVAYKELCFLGAGPGVRRLWPVFQHCLQQLLNFDPFHPDHFVAECGFNVLEGHVAYVGRRLVLLLGPAPARQDVSPRRLAWDGIAYPPSEFIRWYGAERGAEYLRFKDEAVASEHGAHRLTDGTFIMAARCLEGQGAGRVYVEPSTTAPWRCG